ncbi:hypothetical protein MRX96_012474 [Rhipicephalus microplus]
MSGFIAGGRSCNDVVIGILSTATRAQLGLTKNTTRHHCAPVAAKRAAVLKTVLEALGPAANLRSMAALRQKLLVTCITSSVVKEVIGITAGIVLGSVATAVLTPYCTLGVVLIVLSVTFESVCLAIYPSLHSERMHAFVARLFGPCEAEMPA